MKERLLRPQRENKTEWQPKLNVQLLFWKIVSVNGFVAFQY